MGYLSKTRQIVALKLEATNGVAVAPNVATSGTLTDMLPMLREVTTSLDPIRTERNTLRMVQTPLADIYSGKALATIDFTVELTSNPTFTGLLQTDPNGQTLGTMQPPVGRVIQCCSTVAFLPASTVTGIQTGRRIRAWRLGTFPGGAFVDNGPLRHLEAVVETPDALIPSASVFGDTYADDGTVYLLETGGYIPGTSATVTSISSARGALETVFNINATNQRSAPECFGWMPLSDLNNQSSCTIDVYKDGKIYRFKGCMGSGEFVFEHGAAVLCHFVFKGVFVNATDGSLPTGAVEPHKYPPTFLGPRFVMRRSINQPAAAEKYGTDGGGAGVITGALNQLSINMGADVIARENSIDPNGVNFSIITGRKPTGKFNPDEVLNSEFNLISFFAGGTPLRGRCIVLGPAPTGGATWLYDQPQTQIFNEFDFFMPGMVFSDVVDGDRESIQAWDGTFDLKGGDYDPTAQGESVGSDNELLLVHR